MDSKLVVCQVRLGGKSKLDGSQGGLLAVVPKAGLVLVGGDKCVHVVRTADVEGQDKTCSKQERAQENSAVAKVIKSDTKVSNP